MTYQYFVTAHKSTAVSFCETGQFTSENHLNLILAKNSEIEIFVVGPAGLRSLKKVGINGRISLMLIFRPINEQQDCIFIVTSKLNAMILGCKCDTDDNISVFTRSHGNIGERIEVSDSGIIGVIDPKFKVIVLRLYDGVIKLILIDKITTDLKNYNIRVKENDIEDIKCLHGRENPTFIFLYKNNSGQHIKCYELSLTEREFVPMPWNQDNVAIDVLFLIPVSEPFSGIIAVGKSGLLYHDGTYFVSVEPSILNDNCVICYAKVDNDGCRYVLGDSDGHLFMLFLEKDSTGCTFSIKDIKVELLGEVTIPECITYLDNGVFFIGSRFGDSQLVKLNSEINPGTKSYVTVMEYFSNLAPIIDMVVVDLEKQGQGQLITCSGGHKEGSLKIIRNGIGIEELATFEMQGIKGIWTLKVKSQNNLDNTIVLSFVGHTRVLSLQDDEIEETELPGFQSELPTIYCRNINERTIIQVTPQSIRIIEVSSSENILSEWKTPSKRNISIVSSNKNQMVCAAGPELYYIEIRLPNIVQKNCVVLNFEVSCLDISVFPLKELSEFVAVGLWTDVTCRILRIPSLEEVHKEYLGGDIISRSILFSFLEHEYFLFCALGDGSMFYFNFDCVSGQISEKKKVTLGTQPLGLKSFQTLTTSSVFVCSDRPTIIYSSNHKLVFSNVNLKEVHYICRLNSDAFTNSVIIFTESTVIIGTINEIQKLHIRSVPLGETPRRIAHQESTETLGVISTKKQYKNCNTMRQSASTRAQNVTNSQLSTLFMKAGDGECKFLDNSEEEIYYFLLIDQHTFEIIHAHQMIASEYCLSLITAKLGWDTNFYYIVGTAIVKPDESEPKYGRILLFTAHDRKLQQVYEKCVEGACYSLVEFNGKLLACINSTVRLFQWSKEKDLVLECSHSNNITALYSKTKGDFVLIGDIMRAITLLMYNSVNNCFEEISRDYNPKWMTAVEILDDETFLGTENYLNLFVCQKDGPLTSEYDCQRMMVEMGHFHLGDLVNIIRHGSLVMNHLVKSVSTTSETVLIGTVTGLIGVVASISQELYELLAELQKKLVKVIQPVGFIDHTYWRSYSTDVKTKEASGFIDGDLIEEFLDLKRKQMLEVVEGLKIDNGSGIRDEDASIDDIIKIVEDLTRIH